MATLKAFLASHSITTHTVAAVFASLVLAYSAVPAFHDLVLHVYNAIPGKVQEVILAALGLYAWYRNGQKPA